MKRPRICLVAPPYSGHLHPVLGLADALKSVADVMVVSTPTAEKAVLGSGFRFQAILADKESIVWNIATPGHAVKSDPVKLFRQFRANVSLQSDALGELRAVFRVWKPDLVIADFTLPVAAVAAKYEGAR
jgi:UDP:flavonoid glycosyltransferase YjiC (YdhE family)